MSGKTATSVNRQRLDQRLRQMDLFRAATVDSAVGAPAWQELPAEARSMLTSLIAQLILEHAGTTVAAPAREAGHDL
jgi:acyl-CoA reductase-like NAD-dependent aldehyde dehydrogenase